MERGQSKLFTQIRLAKNFNLFYITYSHPPMPMWRNGRRGRLKIFFGQPSAGSSPVIGTLNRIVLTIRFFFVMKRFQGQQGQQGQQGHSLF